MLFLSHIKVVTTCGFTHLLSIWRMAMTPDTVPRLHAPYDRYAVAFMDMGIAFLSEVEWTVARNHRLHDHGEVQLLWILEGSMGLVIDGKRWDSPAGTCCVIPSGIKHRVFQRPQAPGVVFLDLRLAAAPAAPMLRWLERLGGQLAFRGRVEKFRAGAAELRGALALPSLRRTTRVQAILWDLLDELAAQQAVPRPKEPNEAGDLRLRIADSIMRDSLAEAIDVERLAAAAGLSPSQLTRLGNAAFGMGPAQRLRHQRIDKARTLLATTTLTVKEVAHVCGFACPNHFCRVFLKLTGSPPTEFRTAQVLLLS